MTQHSFTPAVLRPKLYNVTATQKHILPLRKLRRSAGLQELRTPYNARHRLQVSSTVSPAACSKRFFGNLLSRYRDLLGCFGTTSRNAQRIVLVVNILTGVRFGRPCGLHGHSRLDWLQWQLGHFWSRSTRFLGHSVAIAMITLTKSVQQ